MDTKVCENKIENNTRSCNIDDDFFISIRIYKLWISKIIMLLRSWRIRESTWIDATRSRLAAIVITANLRSLSPHGSFADIDHNSSLQRSIAARDMQIIARIVASFHGAIDTISLSRVDDGCARRMHTQLRVRVSVKRCTDDLAASPSRKEIHFS